MTSGAIIKFLKVMGLLSLSLVFGFVGFSLLFSDLAPGESLFSRLVMAALVSLVAGIIIGYLGPTDWLISCLAGWGGTLLALQSLLSRDSRPAQALVLLLISPGAALLGGYLGSLAGRKWPPGKLLRRTR